MNRAERQWLQERIDVVRRWAIVGQGVAARRAQITARADEIRQRLAERIFWCDVDGEQVSITPMDEHVDGTLVDELITARALPPLTAADESVLSIGSAEVQAVLERAATATSAGRMFWGSGKRREVDDAVRHVHSIVDRGVTEQLEAHLAKLTPRVVQERRTASTIAQELTGTAHLVSDADVRAARSALETADRVQELVGDAATQIQVVGEQIREVAVYEALAEMPLESLRASTSGRLRVGAIEAAGLSTVQVVLDNRRVLHRISGVGEQTRRQVLAAAETMRSMVHRDTPLRIDVKRRDAATTTLLGLLRTWGHGSTSLARARERLELSSAVAPMINYRPRPQVPPEGAVAQPSHFIVAGSDEADSLRQLLGALAALDQDMSRVTQPVEDPWQDFLAHPADYLGWLTEFGFQTEDEAAAQGQLSPELIERVRAQDLDTSLLRDVSLRGYQDFGARFAVVQRKVIIGDEMGLGKTIEALAVLGHLHAKGGTHSVVVCPAGVVSNWLRELYARSDLAAYRLHGQHRESRARAWIRRGGVAVTTFATLRAIQDELATVDDLQAVVVDEAHYIKNPTAKRTQQTRDLVERSDHALFLTGTPIENRLEEFRNLVSYLQPDLLREVTFSTPLTFARGVAPAYLRRNQEDVLTELPERIDVEEWLPMSSHDQRAYERAVQDGNFMAMRRAALLTGDDSTKLERLDEIVDEARSNHRKVIIFSYFRDVLDEVMDRVDDPVMGPLTGSVPAQARQEMVDAFSAAEPGAVLVSQITAGGIGLNIQAGSVIVICEPQVKPSIETQAVARAHRMGQTETVQVHRLLSDEGVDRRLVEVLTEKQRLFDEFARVSHTADSAPEALDISEAELAREVIAAERERIARRDAAAEDAQGRDEEIA